MGGEISLVSSKGKGSTFHFYIDMKRCEEKSCQFVSPTSKIGIRPDTGKSSAILAHDISKGRSLFYPLLSSPIKQVVR